MLIMWCSMGWSCRIPPCQALEEEFDLGFYPSKIVSFLQATEVASSDGILRVKLSLSF
ncbi:hypothetical protein ACFTAO_35015 [Paenibacillus rhizoplanae]